MSNLYELTGEVLQLQSMLEDVESNEDIEAVVKDTLEAVGGEYDDKIEAYAKVIKNLEAQMTALKAEADRLNDKKKVIENNITRMKSAIFDSMKAVGKPKAGGNIFTVAIQKNGGKCPVILKDGITTNDVPEKYRKVTVDFDNAAIREALDAGEALEFAQYGERGESLRIK